MRAITLDEALRHCYQMTKAHSSTFWLGSQLFSRQARQAVRVVYAVCRSGDDAVDEAGSVGEARERLEHWQNLIKNAYTKSPTNSNPLEIALSWVLSRYDIPKEAFDELYLGLESDLKNSQQFETLDELLLYCRYESLAWWASWLRQLRAIQADKKP
ncbi:MAG: squalene/phytoene synthase family protein [Deinococcales bacterium]